MRRREFITLIGGAAAIWPLAATAQRSGVVPKVGVMITVAEDDPEGQTRILAFRQGLADLGWKDGQNIHLEYRWSAGKSELIRQYAEELVALTPAVILANGTPAVVALKSITKSIPIVFALAIDPVGLGHVKSLSHPGGNITGFTFINPELIGKWTGLLKDVIPGITRAALLCSPNTATFYHKFVQEIEAARQPGAIELIAMSVGTTGEMEKAINALARKPDSGLIIGPDVFTIVHIKQIAQLVGKIRLPAISVYRQFAVEGGLMAYGPNTADIFRRSAEYVDRILKGANPAELPVQQPSKFEFIINLKTARSFGLTMPPGVLSIADEVIE